MRRIAAIRFEENENEYLEVFKNDDNITSGRYHNHGMESTVILFDELEDHCPVWDAIRRMEGISGILATDILDAVEELHDIGAHFRS